MKTILVIYHFPCNDGFGAALAAWLSLCDRAEYLPWNYGREEEFEREWLPKCEGRKVYVLDFSFKKPLYDKLRATAKCLILLDHHKSAFQELAGVQDPQPTERIWDLTHNDADELVSELLLDNAKSGALLTWEHFHPHPDSSVPIPIPFRHLDDYDRWQFKIPGTREFDRNLRSQPYTFEAWREIFLNTQNEDWHFRFIQEGTAILRAHEQTVAAIVRAAKRPCNMAWRTGKLSRTDDIVDGEEWNIAIGSCANVPGMFASDVGHALAVESGTFGMTWYVRFDGRVSCSLRSEGDYDVSVIARALGGGGHRNAAGFETDLGTLESWTH